MKNKIILTTATFMAFMGFSQMSATNNDDLIQVNLDNIVYVEEDVDVDLGFDHYQYLPEDFDAYRGMKLELNDIEYIECEEAIEIDFDTEDFLPTDFNPYSTS